MSKEEAIQKIQEQIDFWQSIVDALAPRANAILSKNIHQAMILEEFSKFESDAHHAVSTVSKLKDIKKQLELAP